MEIKVAYGLLLLLSVLSVASSFRDAPLGDIYRDLFADEKKVVKSVEYVELFTDSTGTDETTEGSGDVDSTIEPDTTVESSTTTTIEASTTTASTTTTTTTNTPTTTRPPQQVPDIAGESYYMNLSLSFAVNCAQDENCRQYTRDIEKLLSGEFENATGDYGFEGIEVIEYKEDDTAYHTIGNTIVFYEAQYALETALDSSFEILNEINNTVFVNLKNQTIDGNDIDDEYLEEQAVTQLNEAEAQLEEYNSNLCAFIDDNPENNICEFGHYCRPWEDGDDVVPVGGAVCEDKCVPHLNEGNCDDEYGFCVINRQGDAECMCEDNTLQISSSNCFHQNYLIFICAVAGGVLIIALVVVIIVLAYRRRGNETDRASRTSAKDILHHERYDADAGQSFQMRNERGGSISSRSSENRGLDQGSTTFVGPSKGKSKSKEPRKRSQHHQAHHNKAYDWDDSERVRLEDLEDDRKRSHYDPYYQEILESESFKDFKPKLDHIDHNKVYAFRRPMFASRDGGESSKTYESRWEDTD